VRQNGTPQLDDRDAAAIAKELLARRLVYVPEWQGGEERAGWALLQLFARFMQALVLRLNRAPDKNKLAFLDMLGLNLIPPQAARAPMVFLLAANAVDSRVPSGSRLAAPPGPGRQTQMMFETEAAIGLAAAKLAEVVTLWPGRDRYAEHSAEAVGGRPFRLFAPLKPVPHVLYLAHQTLFGFAGQSSIELAFELVTPGGEPLDIIWEYWDGKVWRGFKPFAAQVQQAAATDSVDGTSGLTRSGVVRLATDCAETAKQKINGLESFWVQGRLSNKEPIPPDPSAQLPVVDSIQLRSAVDRELALFTEAFPRYEPSGGAAGHLQVGVRDEGGTPILAKNGIGIPTTGVTVTIASLQDPSFPPITGETNAAGQGTADFVRLPADLYSIQISFAGVTTSARGEVVAGSDLVMDFTLNGLLPDKAFTDGTAADPSQTFYPFGQQPQPGTAFYFTNEEVFSKAGAEVELLVVRAATPQDASEITTTPPPTPSPTPTPAPVPLLLTTAVGTTPSRPLEHEVAWEYWDGRRWTAIAVTAEPPLAPGGQRHDLNSTAVIRFVVPADMTRLKVNDQEGLWTRARLVSGGFGSFQTITWADISGVENTYTQILPKPPALSSFRMGYRYRSPTVAPDVTLTFNDFRYEDHSEDVRWPGQTFPPYQPVADNTPTLYLGFDKPLPVDRISLFLDIQEVKGIVEGPPLAWDYWDGTAWRELAVADETAYLRLPGMLSFIGPALPPRFEATVLQANAHQIRVARAEEAARFREGDQVVIQQGGSSEVATVNEVRGNLILTPVPLGNIYTGGSLRLADLARFGTPRQWIRGRLKEDGMPVDSQLNGLYLNAVWAAQVQTVNNELLGGSTGQPDQTFRLRQTPVLEGETIEIRELEGVRTQVELPILKQELQRQGVLEADIREVQNGEGRVTEVWIRWHSQPHLFFSGREDRHYVVDRVGGLLMFGDGVNGKIPPIGTNNILARQYRFGGGQAGDVPAGAITQLLSGVPAVQAVTNPRPAEGGADAETIEAINTRGPQSIRHRQRAISAQDYEALARQASPGIGIVRALPATDHSGRHAPGWVTIVILPQSLERRPQPSYELRRRVRRYVEERAPAVVGVPHYIHVTGPDYLPVGVAVTIAPVDPGEAGPVEQRTRQALEGFLHPVTGGPEGMGWVFGRDVFLSDVAALLEALPGVDYVEELHLLVDGALQGERVPVPPHRMVAAGDLRIKLKAAAV
jgi:hypothetical protein